MSKRMSYVLFIGIHKCIGFAIQMQQLYQCLPEAAHGDCWSPLPATFPTDPPPIHLLAVPDPPSNLILNVCPYRGLL